MGTSSDSRGSDRTRGAFQSPEVLRHLFSPRVVCKIKSRLLAQSRSHPIERVADPGRRCEIVVEWMSHHSDLILPPISNFLSHTHRENCPLSMHRSFSFHCSLYLQSYVYSPLPAEIGTCCELRVPPPELSSKKNAPDFFPDEPSTNTSSSTFRLISSAVRGKSLPVSFRKLFRNFKLSPVLY